MKCFKGWLFTEEEKTKKPTPFFLKVRSEDIVNTGSVSIDEHLTKSSLEWTKEILKNNNEESIYRFKTDREVSNTYTPINAKTGEQRYSNLCKSELIYNLHKDGRYSINGYIQLDRNDKGGLLTLEELLNETYLEKIIALPYSVPNIYTKKVWFEDGTNMMSLNPVIEESDIDLHDLTTRGLKIPYLLHIYITPPNDDWKSEWAYIQRNKNGHIDNDGKTYLSNIAVNPIFNISIEGFWK